MTDGIGHLLRQVMETYGADQFVVDPDAKVVTVRGIVKPVGRDPFGRFRDCSVIAISLVSKAVDRLQILAFLAAPVLDSLQQRRHIVRKSRTADGPVRRWNTLEGTPGYRHVHIAHVPAQTAHGNRILRLRSVKLKIGSIPFTSC